MAGGSCSDIASAPDFNAFDDQATCSDVVAIQHSTLGTNAITCQGSAVTAGSPGLLQNGATSEIQVEFVLRESMHYTLSGQMTATSLLTETRLTGPSGVMHQVNGTASLDFCGTLAPGQYVLFSRARGVGGGSGQHNIALRIAKPGDVNGDQSVNVDDLLSVIGAWGGCGNPQDCPQDITCNNEINIDDLLAVIGNWG